MRYACLTTKHHGGFCLYDSDLTDFTAPKTAAGRDLVAEFVDACRKHGLRISLYHTLNDWMTRPNATDALEHAAEHYQPFLDYVHAQIRELMTKYGTIDVMWYDGWWPFDGAGWQAEKLNATVRELQPGILVNSRCGLPGDFDTPEGHLAASAGLWEACMTLNDHWGFHQGDHNWKSPKAVASMLRRASAGGGNLLLNVGPRGDGSIPEETGRVLDRVGAWLQDNGEAIYDTERFDFSPRVRQPGDRGDWCTHGGFTAAGQNLYLHITSWPGERFVLAGLECAIEGVEEVGTNEPVAFKQEGGRLSLQGLAAQRDTTMPVVLRIRTRERPRLYRSGGCPTPQAPHCRYDPVDPDIAW